MVRDRSDARRFQASRATQVWPARDLSLGAKPAPGELNEVMYEVDALLQLLRPVVSGKGGG